MFCAGDTKSTTRRLSDTPSSMRHQFGSDEAAGDIGGKKSMLEAAHELVAKALGGGSRGEFVVGVDLVLADADPGWS